MKDVQYMSPVQYMPGVTYMKGVQYMPNVQYMQGVTGLLNVTPYSSYGRVPKVTSVDDSYEKANSLLDVLLGETQRDELLDQYDMFRWAKDIPILDAVVGIPALVYDKYLDPIHDVTTGEKTLDQAGKEIFLNTLTEVSEDLDIFSNLFKSQMPEAGGGFGLDNLSDSLGLNGRRVSYNVHSDTGNATTNFLADVALEMVSDPLTVIAIGKSVAAGIGKAGAKSTAETAVREAAEGLSDQAAKDYAKAVTKTVVRDGKKATYDTILDTVNKRSLTEISEASLKKATPEIVDATIKSRGYQMFASATKIGEAANTLDKAITKVAWGITPVGVPAHYAKELLGKAAKHIYTSLMLELEKYDLLKNYVKKQGAYEEALQTAMLKNKAINETIFKNNEKFFRLTGLDEVKLQEAYYAMLKGMQATNVEKDVYEEFFDYLMKNNERFAALYNTDKAFHDYIESKAFNELVEVTSVAPNEIIRAQLTLENKYHNASLNTMRKYVADNKDNLENVYRYIDEEVLKYNGVQYGLKDLDGFLSSIIGDPNVSGAYRDQLATLLESVGINRNNATSISRVINSKIKDKDKAIKLILDRTTGSKLLEFKEYNKMITKITNQMNDNTGSVLNKVWKEDIATYNEKLYKDVMNNAFHNIKEAAKSIQNNTDVEHAVAYIQNAIRMQDLPEWQETMQLIDKLDETALGKIDNKTTDYIKDLDKFFKDTDRIVSNLDKKLDIAFDIPAWYSELTHIKDSLDKLQNVFYKSGDAFTVQPATRINRLRDAIEVFTKAEIKDSLVNYVDDINGMVQAQLSHLGMFNVLTQHTHMTNDKDLKFFLDQMANPDSVYRQRIIPDLIESFRRADMPEQARSIEKVVAQIDTVTNLNVMLSTELSTSYQLSNRLQQDLRNIVFDSIENHKSYLITDILSEEVTAQSYSAKQAGEKARTYIEILRDQIDERVDRTELIQQRILKETGSKEAVEEIKESLHTLLDNYIHEQSKIARYIDNVSLSTLYDLDTIKILELTNKIRFDLARNTDMTVEFLNEYDTVMRDFAKFAEGIQLGVDDIQKINAKLAIPLSYYDATKQLKKVCEQYNLYSSSIESSTFVAKYIIENSYDYTDKITGDVVHHAGFEETFKLSAADIKGSQEEYTILSEKLWSYRDVLHEDYKYEKDYIDRLREVLTNTYSRPNALFAPTDPRAYFNALDAEQLLAWEVVSRSNLSINNKAAFYSNLKLYRQNKNLTRYSQADFLARLDDVFRNLGFTNDEEVAYIATIARNVNAIEYANKTIDANLMYTLHSLDDLGKYKDDVVTYLKNDVADMDYIVKTITEIENDPTIRMHYDDFGNPDDLYKLGGASYGYEENIYQNQTRMYAERCSAKAISIAEMDAEELATHIYRQTPGAMVFHNANISVVRHVDGSITWEPLENVFNFSDKELKDAGLKIMKETRDDGDWYFIRLIDHREHTKIPTYKALPTTHEDVQKKLTDLIDNYRYRLNLWEDDVPSNILTVETLNQDTWNKFMDAHSDFFGDIKEQKLYQKFTPTGHSMFFDKSFERINYTVVGGFDTYNAWNALYSTDFIPRSTELTRNTLAGLTTMVNRSNKINKYLSLFFNNDYALDSPLMTKMFEGANNKKIADFFAEGKYKVAILRADNKGLPKVFDFEVTNRRSLDKAIAEGGILVPRETYNAMMQVVNNRKMTNSLLDVYRRVVPSTYKSMYLFTAGFQFRNALDTLLVKNMNELGGITALPEVVKYEYAASKAFELHNNIQLEVFEKTGGETFNKKTLLEVLEKHTQEDVEVYFLTDLFIESEASGSFSKSMSSFLEAYNKAHSDNIRAVWEQFYEDKVLFGKQWYNPLHHAHELTEHIEQTGRFGLFLASVDSGMPVSDAIDRVVKTHFNYDAGGDLMKLCERIFWFSTFPINNFNYYVEGGLTKSPTLIKLIMDTQVASWNNGEYTYEELKKTNFLAYHTMTGNIRIGNWIVKTSPSLFDFIGLVADPVGNIKDRLNPILSIAMNPDNIEEELNPAITQWRNYQKFKEGNPIPSILSKINEYSWDRVLGKWRNRYTPRGTWTTYPKIKKPTAQIRYLRKYYSRRYSTNVRRLNRTSLYHDAINYYRVYKRGVLYRDL